jgi:hypothetical protein
MTDQTNIDRRAKPKFALVWSVRAATAFAGTLVERFLTNDTAAAMGSMLDMTAADIRSYALFFAILFLTEPIQTIKSIGKMLSSVIYKIRVLCHDLCGYIKDGMNKPIEGDKE